MVHPRIPSSHYLIALTRVQVGTTALWPLTIHDKLPFVPVPLQPPDDDVVLDLPDALAAMYDEAAYDLSIDYQQPPSPPDISDADQEWTHTLLRAPFRALTKSLIFSVFFLIAASNDSSSSAERAHSAAVASPGPLKHEVMRQTPSVDSV
jgi:Protein of unknown function (DUF4058)